MQSSSFLSMKGIFLLAFFTGWAHLEVVLLQGFFQHPETQHGLIGDNFTFSCYASPAATHVSWSLYTPSGTFKMKLGSNTQDVVMLTATPGSLPDTINTSIIIHARQSWNNTIIRCQGEFEGTDFFSNEATLIVYSSLGPLPPSNLAISSVNRSTAIVTWTPSLQRWDSYPVDSFNMIVTNNSITILSDVLESNAREYILANFSQPSCSELNFSIAAVSLMYGESDYTIVNKKFGSDLEEISKYLNIDTKVYFQSNGTPIVDVEIQIPSTLCFYENWTINYTVSGDSNSSLSGTMSSNFPAVHIHNLLFSVVHGLLMNQNYTLSIVVFTDSGESSITASANFDTTFLLSYPLTCYSHEKKVASEVLIYKITIGICLSAAILILIFLVTVLIWVHINRGKQRQSKKLGDSTSRVCNAMVHNPIYDGPIYESVQLQFNTLTVATLQASNVSDTSADHPCDCSPPSTPTSSEKSARYVDPPTQIQVSKPRSKSVVSHCSAPGSIKHTGNISRSISVSGPVIKKTPEQRYLMSTSGPMSAWNPVVLTDVDENYTEMSLPDALVGMAEWSELSPEDTDKYKRY